MLRTMMTSKIHRATVTQADLHYVGSVTVDADLLDAADLLAGELVHIVDVTNGARLETYTIAGERGSGVLGINGAAAHLVHPGDLVILIAYGQMDDLEAREHRPHVVFVDADNAIMATGFDAAEAVEDRGLVRGDATAVRQEPASVSSYATSGPRPGPPADAGAAGLRLPGRLAAPAAGWTIRADVVVVGSGIAGLTAALRLRERLPADGRVLVVTKDVLSAGSTRWAQGGIAAALGPGDTPAQHEVDTLVAGAGACDAAAVRTLVTEGPDAVRELIALGTVFDHDPDGVLSLTREGGHHRDRIAHAGGDATGAEIQRALTAAVTAAPEIEVVEHALALDLLLAEDGGVAGLTLHVMGEGQHDGVGAVRCRAVVLASGGLGQVFSQTTNPAVSTGDGMALALRAGAALRDLEYVQFHPTVMWLGADSRGQQPLVSEAVRGEGAFLVDDAGNRFMAHVHELADLAPRDVVAKAITRRMHETGRPHMWLDARHLGQAFWERRFPTILATARSHGVDPVTELLPVAPACHYASGGVRTDLDGRSDVPGLYATGEVACSGVHGANRLASNSLLEGLVFSRRIAAVLPEELRAWSEPASGPLESGSGAVDPGPRAATRRLLQETMTDLAGVLRSADGLDLAAVRLADLAGQKAAQVGLEAWEATNLVTLSAALTAAARLRQETRGSHWREDHPRRDDDRFAGHVDVRLEPDGDLATRWTSAPASDGVPTVAAALTSPAGAEGSAEVVAP